MAILDVLNLKSSNLIYVLRHLLFFKIDKKKLLKSITESFKFDWI